MHHTDIKPTKKKYFSGITLQLAVYSLRTPQSLLDSKCTSLAALSYLVFLRKQLTFLFLGSDSKDIKTEFCENLI